MVRNSESKTTSELPEGVTLVRRLTGAGTSVRRIAWSPDGTRLACVAQDSWLRVWDLASDLATPSLVQGTINARGLAWAPNGRRIATVDDDMRLRVWNSDLTKRPDSAALAGGGWSVAWSPDGRRLASGAVGELRLWDAETLVLVRDMPGHTGCVSDLAWSLDGRWLASVCTDGMARLWGVATGDPTAVLSDSAGGQWALAWSPDGCVLAYGGRDKTIWLWGLTAGAALAQLEGHTDAVHGLGFSPDGRILMSAGSSGLIRLWDAAEGVQVAQLSWKHGDWWLNAFHPTEPLLASADNEDGIDIWRLDIDQLLRRRAGPPAVRYVTAKIPLVGDQLVGKTTLAHRLLTGEFKLFPRTHGQQFWPFPALGKRRSDGTECEAILWDLAGQPDYRLTHSLFLGDAHLALVLFAGSDRQQPLKGAEYWLKALRRRQGPQCQSVLVATQVDVGDVSVTREEIDAFCHTQGVTGGFLRTSAQTGEGIDALIAKLQDQIGWESMPATITTATFKRIKDFVLDLKAREDARRRVLLTPDALRTALEASDPAWTFSDAEMLTAVGHLENHGFVTRLRTPGGETRVLLAPDTLINLVASVVNEARRNPRGLGALREADVLGGSLQFPEVQALDHEDRGTLLDAAVALFVEHNVCFRETLGAETLLVFPALLNQRKPTTAEGSATVEDVSYRVEGAVEHLYSAMVVLLGYTNTFARTSQWQDRAEYETAARQLCGFRQVNEREGETTFVLYYALEAGPPVQRLFEGLFETFLLAHDVRVTKYPAVECPKCRYRQERDEIVKRIEGKTGFIFCAQCGNRIPLPELGESLALTAIDPETIGREREVARMRTEYETALSHVKGLVRDRKGAIPTCFVSYAWGDSAQERWVANLVADLLRADVEVVFDRKDNAAIGSNVARFLSDGLERAAFVAVVGTKRYVAKYRNEVSTAGSIVAAEMDLILQRLTASEERKATVLPMLLEGDESTSLPPLLRGRVWADFREPWSYFATLFDLVLTLHGIAVDDPAVADLRELLRWRESGRKL